jgi:conjugal transfer mating pair stabilization protein TraN
MRNNLTLPKIIITLSLIFICAANQAQAGARFISNYPCSDAVKTCVSSGTKEIDGFSVHRDCWKWVYSKKCNYPSKNDCAQHMHCYSLGQRNCLLRDTLGNCINIQKEFSCKRWEPTYVEEERVRYGLEEKDGEATLVCKGIPCIDGNCVDKSYDMDADMVKSVSQLGAMSKGKDSAMGIKIFEGIAQHCSKKDAGWQNCCKIFPKGWGKHLGAKCMEDERILSDRRQKNLCEKAGTSKIKGVAGASFGRKHHFCCFGNILEKVIQKEARKQLGRSFGSGGQTDCSGLSLEDLERVDFSQMDFSEVAAYFLKKIAIPDVGDVTDRINAAYANTSKFDHKHPGNEKNRLAGVNWNRDIMGSTPEEQRIEAERLEKERLEAIRLAEIEAEKVLLEQEHLKEIARKKEEVRIETQNIQNQIAQKEQALVKAKDGEKAATLYWNNTGHKVYSSNHPGYQREWDKVQVWRDKCAQLDSDVRTLKYKLTRLK